jgi:hypothetical protein
MGTWTLNRDGRRHAWALAVVWLLIIIAYGAIWTRGVQGDDLCMCELASAHGFWDAVQKWLQEWNGRLFLALTQVGTYHLPWFADPLHAPWYLVHAMSVLAHIAVCSLFFRLLVRAGVSAGASLTVTLVLAVHPITSEPVLWLAESYGYVLGNLLTLLAVWTYLEYEAKGRVVWLVLAVLLALCATLGIEQHLMVLGVLAIAHLLRARWHGTRRAAWLPLLVVFCCALVFVTLHFFALSGTSARLARAVSQAQPVSEPGLAWRLAWWLSLVPGHSFYGGALRWGWNIVAGEWRLVGAVVTGTIAATWRVVAASSWNTATDDASRDRHLWLMLTGTSVFAASLLPFAVTGKYGIAVRNMYVALPGLLIVCAAALDLLARRVTWGRVMRLALVPAIAAFVAASLVINVGIQAEFAQSWRLHRDLIRAVNADAAPIREAGSVQVTGIPAAPYASTSMLGNAWAFPCLVRWVLGDGEVSAWNNLMPSGARTPAIGRGHRILWPPAH